MTRLVLIFLLGVAACDRPRQAEGDPCRFDERTYECEEGLECSISQACYERSGCYGTCRRPAPYHSY